MADGHGGLIGRHVRIKDAKGEREESVRLMVGIVADTYANKAHVVYLVRSAPGVVEEFGIFIDIDRLETVGDGFLVGENAVQYHKEPEQESPEKFTVLERHTNRFAAFLVARGYYRYEVTQANDETPIVVWAGSTHEVALLLGEKGESYLSISETSTNGKTFERGDCIRERELSEPLELL